ncbi:hypothetical protein FisN_25Lh223 [Fistulifera solaris]|uniref:Uncharacterized protein n=1 Tax=Fistulifera solaris TaxID=1519565 RepID=A0A1Z5KRJ6_FISSO|nr:hypothetical protein FisN_25Lh223 [Fistulifera solaris]|eukprot:GAX28725.1 hypothetical protein FisN_25Lh223 [Fistulifera solaris]
MSVSRGANRYRDPSRFVSPVSIPFDEALLVRGRTSDSNGQFTCMPPGNPEKAELLTSNQQSRRMEPEANRYGGITSWKANNGFLQFVARPCAANTTDSVLPYDLQKNDSLQSLEDFLSVAENNPYTLIKDPSTKDRREDNDGKSSPIPERDSFREKTPPEGITLASSASSEDVFAGLIYTEKMAGDKTSGRALLVNSNLHKTQHREESSMFALSAGLPTTRLSNVKHPKAASQVPSSLEFEMEKEILTHRPLDEEMNMERAIINVVSDGDTHTVYQSNVELTLEDFEKTKEITAPDNSLVRSASRTFSVSPSLTSTNSKSFILKPVRMLKKSWSKLKFGYRRKKSKGVILAEPIDKDWSSCAKPATEQQKTSDSSLKREPAASIETLPTVSTKNSAASALELPGKVASIKAGRKSRSQRHRISVTNPSHSFASEKLESNPSPSKPRSMKGFIDDCSIVFSRSDFSYFSEYSNSESDCSSEFSDDSLFNNPSKAVAQTATELLNPGSLRVLQEEFVAMFGKPVPMCRRRR